MEMWARSQPVRVANDGERAAEGSAHPDKRPRAGKFALLKHRRSNLSFVPLLASAGACPHCFACGWFDRVRESIPLAASFEAVRFVRFVGVRTVEAFYISAKRATDDTRDAKSGEMSVADNAGAPAAHSGHQAAAWLPDERINVENLVQ